MPFEDLASAKSLGVDFAGGGPGQSTKGRAKRLDKVREWKFRHQMLRAAGISVGAFFKTSVEKTVGYACSVVGISDSLLRRIRRLAGGCTTTRVQGMSLEIDLALSGVKRLDPVYEAHRKPFFAWAAAVWDRTAPEGFLQVALDGL